jgi:hypothetical protein
VKRVRFRNTNMVLLLDDATAELYVNLGTADIIDQRDPTMKKVTLTEPRLIGNNHVEAGTSIEVDNWRADELVAKGWATYDENQQINAPVESVPDPVSVEVPPCYKPQPGHNLSTHTGTLGTTSIAPDPSAAPTVKPGDLTTTGGITTDTTTGPGPAGKVTVVDPLKPGGAVSEARKIP